MNYFLFDDPLLHIQLQPFTLTRPIAGIRVGIFTQEERWQSRLGEEVNVCGYGLLEELWPRPSEAGIWISSAWLPREADADAVRSLGPGEAIVQDTFVLACHLPAGSLPPPHPAGFPLPGRVREQEDARLLKRPWDIFSLNGPMIREDMHWIQSNRGGGMQIGDPYTRVYNPENVWVGENVDCRAAVINASEGPVYIGKGVQIQEGSLIKGPVALLDHCVVNMGAKIRPETTVGPYCKVGGEISNVVFFGYSNKAHDGFLGNSVIGEWCNLGADTNCSNLKNTYGEVKVWSYAEGRPVSTRLQFCGLLMGDHSKTGINFMFNTGTVVGIGCNLFDAGFPPVHIPSFSWGSASGGLETYRFEKFLENESRVMARRNRTISDGYERLLRHRFIEELREKS